MLMQSVFSLMETPMKSGTPQTPQECDASNCTGISRLTSGGNSLANFESFKWFPRTRSFARKT
jgi:hypothetical protein